MFPRRSEQPSRPTGPIGPSGPDRTPGPGSPIQPGRPNNNPGRFAPQGPPGPARPFSPARQPGPPGPARPAGPRPYAPGQEIRRRDFHAPTVNRPDGRPGFNPAPVPETKEDLWRIFIAADLSSEAKAVLTGTAWKVPEFLRPNVRWSRAEMMHLTLRFLGDTAQDRIDAITECMTEAASRSGKFTLRLDDTGAFPDLRQPKVLWVGIKGELDRLKMLQARLEGSLERIGIAGEDRRYNPHLTVGRLQREVPPFAAEQIGQAFAHVRLPEPRPDIQVDSLVLYRSRLMVDGPSYEELARAPLG